MGSSQTPQPLGAGGEAPEKIKIQVRVKKEVEEVKVFKISKKAYNIIRSFVESSPKTCYSWNRGYKLGNTIYFVKPGKWTLTIWVDSEIEKEAPNVHPAVVDVSDVVTITADGLLMLRGVDKVFDLETDDLRAYAVTADVPYAYPITLCTIVAKINEYVDVEFGGV